MQVTQLNATAVESALQWPFYSLFTLHTHLPSFLLCVSPSHSFLVAAFSLRFDWYSWQCSSLKGTF